MRSRACAVALWLALALAAAAPAPAAGYTVDCNHEYTDCETELSKLANEDEEAGSSGGDVSVPVDPTTTTSTTPPPTTKTLDEETTTETKITTTTPQATTEAVETTDGKPKARLLNLNVNDLQNFANALHNKSNQTQTQSKFTDLSDVTLDEEEDERPKLINHDHKKHDKTISDKFYTNLQAPFNPLLNIDKSEEIDTCKENDVSYKVGDTIERGCEETCECTPGGVFECTPRCKHPYIRRGRRLNDPLCFESPVDECCSIVACSTGNQEVKVSKVEVCRYGNDTYAVGSKWNIGCEQKCSCEPNSVVTCKPRCNPLHPSDKCINVQDPADECCEVQVCDVSQDAHEEPENSTTSTTTTTTTTTTELYKGFDDYSDFEHQIRSTNRPLVLTEPIGSVKVLQNNSVQVNLMHLNVSEDPIHLLLSSDGGKTFEDVELKYTNLILNLPGGKEYILKTKETGTKFNFTITASEDKEGAKPVNVTVTEQIGCNQDGQFYEVGEEFHIGCTHLCECTGAETKECVELVCPSHVGLELVSKGCVRWAPSPPPQPPNCCPRAARCLSDGTCHFKGVAIPNWSEVPIALTGCEQRCFCENGDLDCQEVCTPLPPVPPQTLRCPPGHRPAPLNISDEDCCKEWGCVSNAAYDADMTIQTYSMKSETPIEYVTPVALTTLPTNALPNTPIATTDATDFYRHLHPVKSYPKIIKTVIPVSVIDNPQRYTTDNTLPYRPEGENTFPYRPQSENTFPYRPQGENITIFTLEDMDNPLKTIQPDHSLTSHSFQWNMPPRPIKPVPVLVDPMRKLTHAVSDYNPHLIFGYDETPNHPIVINQSKSEEVTPNVLKPMTRKQYKENIMAKVPISKVNNLKYFLPAYNARQPSLIPAEIDSEGPHIPASHIAQAMFAPIPQNKSSNHISPKIVHPLKYNHHNDASHANRGKHLTILNSRDMNGIRINDHEHEHDHNEETVREDEQKKHVLIKAPNPYETVLLRPVKNMPKHPNGALNGQTHSSALDLEHLVSQMEVQSEVNRNLGRSADKAKKGAGATTSPDQPRPHHPSFLPTVPPEIHFPQEDLPDYDQNNLHRPVNSLEPSLPPGLTVPPNYGEENKKLTVISLQADSPTSVKMLFGLPPVLVGLRGSVDLRYTDKPDEDISQWYSQVFAPADEVLTTPRLEFRLTGLKPSTVYKIRGKLFLHNLPVEPESEVYSVRTLDPPTVIPPEEKRREIDSRLTIVDVNDTAAHVTWRHFSEDELRFIDGIQVRYRPVGTPIYSMTELLHHSRSLAELHDLRPGTRYEASLVLVPPPRSTTELHDPGRIEFTTQPYVDPYNWTATIEARVVGSDAAELTWRGVPSPAERWVRVYRAAHACGATRREHDAFRLAARDLPPTIMLSGLQANTRCRVWLELFLTNGKVKTSNVIEINTKPHDSPEDIDNEIEASSIAGAADSRGGGRGDYYGALVVVGVVAALGAMTSLLLLLVLVRRHRPRSVPITSVPSAPRESSLPPYDNPAYKLELQQETMDL